MITMGRGGGSFVVDRLFLRNLCWFLPLGVLLTSAAFGADFTGKVLTPDGKPIKGAMVYYVELRPVSTRAPQGPRDLPTTRTDDAGDFHFPRPQVSEAEFIASADGFGVSSTQMRGEAPVQIRLRPRSDLTVTFVTADNKPVPGLQVSIRQINLPIRIFDAIYPNLRIPGNYRTPWSRTTDASGSCVFAGLPQGGRVTFTMDDARYAELSDDDSAQLGWIAEMHSQPIQLQLAASISGKVFYEATTRPATGVMVQMRTNEAVRRTVTDANGSYVLRRLRPGKYNLCLSLGSEMEKSWAAETSETVSILAGESKTGTNFTLIPGVILSGTVLSADDSKPVGGVRLGIYGPSHPRSGGMAQPVYSDANGAFSARVPPGMQSVYLVDDTPANGFTKPLGDEKDVTIAAGGTASVEFRLPRSAMFAERGKVVDPDGKPVAGAAVHLYFEGRNNIFNETQITTDGDGNFQSAPIEGTAELQIRAKYQDMATPKVIEVHRRDSGDLVIQLQKNALGTVTGRVLDQDGKPLKDAQVESIYSMGRYRLGERDAPTDDQGNYKIDSLWPDLPYTVQVFRDGYGTAESNGGLRVGPGQSTNIADLTLYKRDTAIAGVLLDRNDKPVTGQRITVRGAKTGFSNLTTDIGGKFQCAVVSNDRLTISYNFHTNRLKQQSANAGDQNIVLHTAPPVVAAPPFAPAPPPPPVIVAPAPPPPPPVAAPPAPEPPPRVFDPGDAVTWNGWLFAIVGVMVGGVITVIVNAIVAIRGRVNS
jgi:protocatechuate 3,4-dioxygenase beta subunit